MKLFLSILLLFLFLFVPFSAHAQESTGNQFERGRVLKIVEQGNKKVIDTEQPFQILELKILTGADKDKVVRIEHGAQTTIKQYQLVQPGQEVVLMELGSGDNKEYFIQDKFRLPSLLAILIGFFALVVVFTRIRGILSILGMVVSLAILLTFIVPSIARGGDPVFYTLIGATAIILISIFLAHGFNKRTTIAVGSTFITLLIAVGLSFIFANWANLSGSGSEEAYSLQFGEFANINLRGLLLAGIIIGTLGVLDDITTSLTAAIEEISKADPKLKAKDLYSRGISVGKEHISSLVNTLVLAYAGASMPIFLFFLSIKDKQPLWVTLNSEFLIEEVIRALVGSSSLILAVPITTFLASAIYGSSQKK